jgi:hypothetical protein
MRPAVLFGKMMPRVGFESSDDKIHSPFVEAAIFFQIARSAEMSYRYYC